MKYTYEYKVTVTLDENDASQFERKLQNLADTADTEGAADVENTDATEFEEPEPEGDGHDAEGEPL